MIARGAGALIVLLVLILVLTACTIDDTIPPTPTHILFDTPASTVAASPTAALDFRPPSPLPGGNLNALDFTPGVPPTLSGAVMCRLLRRPHRAKIHPAIVRPGHQLVPPPLRAMLTRIVTRGVCTHHATLPIL